MLGERSSVVNEKESTSDSILVPEVDKKLAFGDGNSHQIEATVSQPESCDGKTGKFRKIKVREVKGETLTSEFAFNFALK